IIQCLLIVVFPTVLFFKKFIEEMLVIYMIFITTKCIYFFNLLFIFFCFLIFSFEYYIIYLFYQSNTNNSSTHSENIGIEIFLSISGRFDVSHKCSSSSFYFVGTYGYSNACSAYRNS